MGRRRPLRRRHLGSLPRFPRGRPRRGAGGGGGAGARRRARGSAGGAGRRERGGRRAGSAAEPGAGARRRVAMGREAPRRRLAVGREAPRRRLAVGREGARRRLAVGRARERGGAGGAAGPGAGSAAGTGRRERGGTGRRERCEPGAERGGGSRWGARPRAAGSRRGARPRAAGSRWGARKRWGSNPLDRRAPDHDARVDGDDPGPLHVELLRCITSAPEDVPRLLVVGHHGGSARIGPSRCLSGRTFDLRNRRDVMTPSVLTKKSKHRSRRPRLRNGASLKTDRQRASLALRRLYRLRSRTWNSFVRDSTPHSDAPKPSSKNVFASMRTWHMPIRAWGKRVKRRTRRRRAPARLRNSSNS